nr:olfactory receptor 38 [Gregopimpla kuwanae]
MNYTIQYTRWFLEFLGIWPMVKKNPSRSEKYFSKILIFLGYGLMAFIMIPCMLHMIFRERDSTIRIKLLGPIGLRLTNIIKYSSIILHRKSIKLCIEHVENDWMMAESENDREIMMRNVNIGRSITVLCFVFMFSGGLSYHTIMPLWRGNKINSLNQTIRPLVYPGYDIFVDPQSSPTYEIIFYTTCVSACVTYTVITAACNLAAVFVTHACGQIQIMMSRLDNLFDSVNDKSDLLKDRVNFVIRCHVRVLRFTKIIERVLREICLVEVVASTLIICLLEYYCMTEWNNSDTVAIITYVLLLVSLSFNIFIFCHIGELLKDQSYEIGRATYMIDWYRLPGKIGLALVMIIAMANYPRKLTAGRMMELSVTSFGTIIKTSVTYLSMLRAVTA